MHKEYIRNVENSNTAVLFIHGILGSPDMFKKYIALVPEDWSVYNMLLDGHGKGVSDFANSSMERWKKQVDSAVCNLSQKHEKIIIVAHSMGTLLAINAIQKYPTKIKQLFLLAVPLKIFLKPIAMITSLKVVFDDVSDDDPVAVSMRDGHSIKCEKNLFLYLSWIPRYLELFRESKLTRERVKAIDIPCNVYLSKKDDMVSVNSCKYFVDNSNINMTILEKSLHLYITDDEMKLLLDEFNAVCSRVAKLK